MIERIMEIILFVINNDNDKMLLSESKINELEKKGYTKSEISTAFSWIFEKIDLNAIESLSIFSDRSKSFRILHNVEKDLFTTQAYTELVQFMSLGLINSRQVDLMIESLSLSGLQLVDSRFLRNYLAALHIESMRFYSTPGRAMLLGNETIN